MLKLTTSEIIAATRDRPLHTIPESDDQPVSTRSKWGDPIWYLDADAHMRSAQACMTWNFVLDDGTLFTDQRHRRLLAAMKRFVWSMLVDPRNGVHKKATGTAVRLTPIRFLCRWMIRNGYRNLGQLNHEACEDFLNDLRDQIDDVVDSSESEAGQSEEEPVDGSANSSDDVDSGDRGHEPIRSYAQVRSRIMVLWSLWRQSSALREAGVIPLPLEPFGGRSANLLAKQMIEDVQRRIPPLPDEVALEIMTEAHKWIGTRADDIIRLHNHYSEVWATFGRGVCAPDQLDREAMARSLGKFEFSVEAGSSQAWHGPLVPGRRSGSWDLHLAEVRRLVAAVRAACCLVIQSETGMRIGEIASMRSASGQLGKSRGPVSMRRSKNGLSELFFLHGLLQKTVTAPQEAEWLCGARPTGTKWVPGPCRAVAVLEELLAPIRNAATWHELRNLLFVNVAHPHGMLMNGQNVSQCSSDSLLRFQRQFVKNYVDLSGLPDWSKLGEDLRPYRVTEGQCLKSHQWRKSFAMYVIRTDRRMIPDIAMQFKHLSIAMVEQSYISDDPDLQRERESQQSRAAAAYIYTVVTGSEPSAGRIAKLIEEQSLRIKSIIGDKQGNEAIDVLQIWCVDRGIKIFSSPHGKCFIRISPSTAECHKVAGTVHWSRTRPNFRTREPELCAGCNCFGVDLDHSDFWVERYIEYQSAWTTAEATSRTAGMRVVHERARQSAGVLRALEIDPESLIGGPHV
ncbi:site-specific integrase [Paraburkholderia sediminicola]|uniref:hypothetical protein n=1 Tax=Paraburkholderia sediminicola TaxID=458836 RepID=UPI0038BE0A6C